MYARTHSVALSAGAINISSPLTPGLYLFGVAGPAADWGSVNVELMQSVNDSVTADKIVMRPGASVLLAIESLTYLRLTALTKDAELTVVQT